MSLRVLGAGTPPIVDAQGQFGNIYLHLKCVHSFTKDIEHLTLLIYLKEDVDIYEQDVQLWHYYISEILKTLQCISVQSWLYNEILVQGNNMQP